jgi:hypothetical protein
MSRKYVIMPSGELGDVEFGEVEETSAQTIRYSLDDSLFLLKYTGAKPHFLYGKDTYTYSEIQAIVATSAWNPPPESDEE